MVNLLDHFVHSVHHNSLGYQCVACICYSCEREWGSLNQRCVSIQSIWQNPLNGEDCWKGSFDDNRRFGSDKSQSESFGICWNYFKIDIFKLWFMSYETLNLKGKKIQFAKVFLHQTFMLYMVLLETKEKARYFKITRCFMWSIFIRILTEKGCCSVTMQNHVQASSTWV